MQGLINVVGSLLGTVRRKWAKLSYFDLLSYTVLKPIDVILSELFFHSACAIIRFAPEMPSWMLENTMLMGLLTSLSLITPEMAEQWQGIDERKSNGHQSLSNHGFTLISHNLWFHFIAGGMWRRSRLLLFVQKVRQENPSVVALQEVFAMDLGVIVLRKELEYLRYALDSLGYKHCTRMPFSQLCRENGTQLGAMNHGCVMFSQFEIDEESVHIFEDNRDHCRKGFQSCLIRMPQEIANEIGLKSIRIWNVHLEHLDSKMKRSQIRELTDSIIAAKERIGKSDDNTGFLCTGDFNICSNDTFGQGLYKGELVPAMLKCGMCLDLFSNTERTFRILSTGNRETTGSYDHMFIDETMSEKLKNECTVVDWKDHSSGLFVSDHFGIKVVFSSK